MNKLSKRLQKIYDLVEGKIVCDVGCDHGKLAFELLKNNKVNFIYISDISNKCLEKAVNLLDCFKGRFKSICCDGLKGYSNIDIQECIIAGMGGEEIIKIISNSPIDIDSYILSPQHNEIMVKEFLCRSGYEITYDIIIKDLSKFYNIIIAKKSNNIKMLSEFDLLFGKDNFNGENADFIDYVDAEIEKINLIIDRVNLSKKLELEKKLKMLYNAKNFKRN